MIALLVSAIPFGALTWGWLRQPSILTGPKVIGMAQLLVDLWPLWVTLGAVITVAGWSYAMHAKATWSWTLAQAVITHISKVDQQEPFEPGDSRGLVGSSTSTGAGKIAGWESLPV